MNQSLEISKSSDELMIEIFGSDVEVINKHSSEPSKQHVAKSYATFSQLMTLAHNFNRKNGHQITSGCNCESCHQKRKSA